MYDIIRDTTHANIISVYIHTYVYKYICMYIINTLYYEVSEIHPLGRNPRVRKWEQRAILDLWCSPIVDLWRFWFLECLIEPSQNKLPKVKKAIRWSPGPHGKTIWENHFRHLLGVLKSSPRVPARTRKDIFFIPTIPCALGPGRVSVFCFLWPNWKAYNWIWYS